MNTCKNCRYFTELHWRNAKTLDIEFRGFGDCSNEHLCESGDNAMADDCLNATCDENRGELEIGQNFGCIYFEQTETKNESKIINYI